jgi:hypothetical protein
LDCSDHRLARCPLRTESKRRPPRPPTATRSLFTLWSDNESRWFLFYCNNSFCLIN